MKKIFYSAILASMILGGAGCKKDYLQTTPTDKIDSKDIFSSTANASVALNGIYR